MRFYRRFLPYGLSAGATVLATLLTLWLEVTVNRMIGSFFYIAVTISAWYGGFRPGVAAIVLSTLAINYYFMLPIDQVQIASVDDVLRLLLFGIVSLTITLMSVNLQESKRKIETLSHQLIKESADRLRIALNAAQMGMWDWNIVTGEITWSPEHEQLFGLPLGSFDGRYETFSACLHPADRAGLNQAVAHALSHHVPYQYEFRVIWADGSVHWIEGRGNVLYNEANQPVRMIGTIMEITARKQTEIALQEREATLRLFTQYAPASIAMFDREMCYVMASQQWLEYFVISGSVIGRSHYEIYPNMPDHWRQAHQRGLAGAIEKCDEELLVRADGTEQWMCWEVRPWHTQGGDLGGIIILAEDITERKHSQTALQQSEERLRLVLQGMPVMLDAFDENWNLITWNQECERVTGFAAAEVIQNPNVMELLYPDATYRQQMMQAWATRGNNYRHWEWEIVCKDNSTRTIAWSNIADLFPIPGWTSWGIGVDVTDRKRAEAEIKQLNAELEQRVAERTAELMQVNDRLLQLLTDLQQAKQDVEDLYNHAPCGYCSIDANGTIIRMNDTELNWFGYSRDEVLHKMQFVDFLTPESQKVFDQNFPKFKQEGRLNDIEFQVLARDGSAHWIALSSTAITDAAGNFLMSRSTAFDISDRKRTEAALAQLASIVESSDEAIIGKTPEGIVLSWNTSAEMLFGYSANDIIGQSINTIIPTDRLEKEAQILKRLKAGEHIQHYETIRQRKDGSLIEVALTLSPIHNQAGQVMGISTIAHDITEKRAVERLKNEFIGIVSHELRTPLTSIRGSLGLLATGVMDDDPAEMKRMIDIAAIDTERLVRLVNDVLDLEKLESGKVSLVREWCDAAVLMQRSIEVMTGIAQEAGVQLVVQPIAIKLWVAPDRIIQTLTNLLSNAIKFSPPGGVVTLAAEIRTLESEDYPSPPVSRPHLRFSVQDQGWGIPADQLERIFGRFQQVDASDSRDKGGTGLGLAICQSIVHQHQGQIWVESTWGQGSTFFFTLPLSFQ